MLHELIGSAAFKKQMQAAVGPGRLPHGVLICGEDGLGRDFAARLLAAELLLGPNAGNSDKNTASRRNAIVGGKDLAMQVLRPEGASNTIRVEAVREARAAVQRTSLAGDVQAVVVQGAHRLHPSSAAALLKVLEEPAPGVYFLLTAPSTAAVLPTIVSRCGVYTLGEGERDECLAFLKKRAPRADGEFLFAVFGGRPGLLVRYAQDKALANRLEEAVSAAGLLAQQDRYGLLHMAWGLEGKKDRALALLDTLQYVLSASLLGREHPRLPALPPGAAARCLTAAEDARRAIDRSGNLRLALTAFCLACLPA